MGLYGIKSAGQWLARANYAKYVQQARHLHIAEHYTEGNANVKTSLTWGAILTVICMLISSGISAEEKVEKSSDIEEWRCASGSAAGLYLITQNPEEFPEERVVVRLFQPVGKTKGKGEVSVAGVNYDAAFEMEGLNRRWVFGEDREYSFVITPEGGGTYYDFSGNSLSPSQTYGCISSSVKKDP